MRASPCAAPRIGDAARAVNQIHSASQVHDELSIDVDVTEDGRPRHRVDDTWQALGRAIGDARAEEIVRASERKVLVAPYIAAPPARHLVNRAPPPSARVPESLYPVELPAREPQALLSAQHPAFQWKETADASLSLQVPVRKPRALRTARLAVACVTAAGALMCLVAFVMSRTGGEAVTAASTGAASRGSGEAPPAAHATLPERKVSPSAPAPSADQAAHDASANLRSSSWTKNVLGTSATGNTPGTSATGNTANRVTEGGDRPGVSVDSLPRANPRPASRKSSKKR